MISNMHVFQLFVLFYLRFLAKLMYTLLGFQTSTGTIECTQFKYFKIFGAIGEHGRHGDMYASENPSSFRPKNPVTENKTIVVKL